MKRPDLFTVFNYLLLTLIAIGTIFPFYYVVIVSFSNFNDYLDSALLYPKTLQWDAYIFVFTKTLFMTGLKNTLIITIGGVAYNMLLTTALAYGLSKSFPGRNFALNLVIVTMFFGGGLIPFYLIVANTLHLSNTLWALILPVGINTFYLIVMKNFFNTLPAGLEESAKIDGANDLQILFRIAIPVSMPVIATFSLFYAVDRWNEWFNAMLFMRDSSLFTLQLVLRDIVVTLENTTTQELGDLAHRQVFNGAVKSATIVIATVPIMFVYPFLQKHFAKGMLLGAIKS